MTRIERISDLHNLFSRVFTTFITCFIGFGLALAAIPALGQHIHELYYNNVSWADTDLTTLTGGATVYPQGITAFYTTPNDQLHVYYVSNNNLDFHIHQLYYNGSSWSDADLTAITGGMSAANSSGMSGFSIGNAQYVYFCGSDFAVHEYAYGNNGNFNWVDTRVPIYGFCAQAPDLVAYTTANNQRHVVYQAPFRNNSRVLRQTYFNGKRWVNQNLTAVRAIFASNMGAFSIGNGQHVFFESPDGHIHHSTFATSWTDQDLTVAASSVPAGTFEPDGVAAFLVPGTTQMEVYYAAASNQDVHQLTFANNAWTDTDLSSLTSSSGALGAFSQFVGFATTPNNQLHFYYPSFSNSEVFQLFFNGSSWSNQLLPSVPVAGVSASMAGFALGNLQHVYYISSH